MFNKYLEDNHMEQLEKIAKKYNLRYKNWSDLVGYETGKYYLDRMILVIGILG